MQSRIISMRGQYLNIDSRTHYKPRIESFHGWDAAVFVLLLWVRVGPRRNNGAPKINLVLRYQKQ